jgi:hypothetical protein
MNKKGEMTIGSIVLLVVAILFGLALINSIGESTNAMTEKQSVDNQSISVVSAFVEANEVNESVNFTIYSQSDWKVQDCPLTSVVLRNGASTELTADTDYVLYANEGVYSLLNTTDTVPATSLNLTYADYDYCADGYNKDSGSRSTANLILIFSTIMLLAAVLEITGITSWTGLVK